MKKRRYARTAKVATTNVDRVYEVGPDGILRKIHKIQPSMPAVQAVDTVVAKVASTSGKSQTHTEIF